MSVGASAFAQDLRAARCVADGDRTALRDLLSRLTPRLRGAAWNLAGGGYEPADLVQEALLRITRPAVLAGYRGEGPLDGYLLSVGVRTMISVARLRRAERERSFSTGEPEVYAGGADDPESRQMSPAVRTALLALPERARTVVLLVTVGDMSYAEVATSLGMEVGTVKSTYSRARSVLRDELAGARD